MISENSFTSKDHSQKREGYGAKWKMWKLEGIFGGEKVFLAYNSLAKFHKKLRIILKPIQIHPRKRTAGTETRPIENHLPNLHFVSVVLWMSRPFCQNSSLLNYPKLEDNGGCMVKVAHKNHSQILKHLDLHSSDIGNGKSTVPKFPSGNFGRFPSLGWFTGESVYPLAQCWIKMKDTPITYHPIQA